MLYEAAAPADPSGRLFPWTTSRLQAIRFSFIPPFPLQRRRVPEDEAAAPADPPAAFLCSIFYYVSIIIYVNE